MITKLNLSLYTHITLDFGCPNQITLFFIRESEKSQQNQADSIINTYHTHYMRLILVNHFSNLIKLD